MAICQRILDRRDKFVSAKYKIFLPIIFYSFFIGQPFAKATESKSQDVLLSKKRQVIQLRQMLASTTPVEQRAEKMFRLAQLEMEIGVLKDEIGSQSVSLSACATTCRRILIEEPTFKETAEVRLLLISALLRQEHLDEVTDVVQELERYHPKSPVRCDAWLFDGDARSSQNKHKEAMKRYRQVLSRSDCPLVTRQQARYRLAWSLIKNKKTDDGALQLSQMLQHEEVEGLFKERVLRDLALAWSTGQPATEAARALLLHGGTTLGWLLVKQVAKRLSTQRRYKELLTFSNPLLQPMNLPTGFSDPSTPWQLTNEQRLSLRRLRLQALAQSALMSELETEIIDALSEIPQDDTHRRKNIRDAVASSLLSLADRLIEMKRSEDNQDQAIAVYQRVLKFDATGESAARARYALGNFMLEKKELQQAASHFEFAAAILPEPLRAQALFSFLFVLQRQLEEGGASEDRIKQRLVQVGWNFALRYPTHEKTPTVLIVTSVQAAQNKDYVFADRACSSFLKLFPNHSRRDEIVDLSLQIATHQQLWEKVFGLVDKIGCVATNKKSAIAPQCKRFQKQAAYAALEQSRVLGESGNLEKALEWAQRALSNLDESSERLEVLSLVATLAARSGAYEEALKRYRQIVSVDRGKWRTLAWVSQGELHEARGQFLNAAKAYYEASLFFQRPDKHLDMIARSVEAYHFAEQDTVAKNLVKRMRSILVREPMSSKEYSQWVLKIGRLYELVEGPAYAYYLQWANKLWRENSRLSAKCLIFAARLTPSLLRRRDLYNQAQNVAGPLRKKDQINESAVKARLGLADLLRSTWEKTSKQDFWSRVAELQSSLNQMTEVLLLRHPVWSAAAGVHVAWGLGEMASLVEQGMTSDIPPQSQVDMQRKVIELRQRQEQVINGIARLADKPAGLNQYSLEVARKITNLGDIFTTDHLPSNGTVVDPILTLITSGKLEGAVKAASQSLKVHGSREDLLCARAVAYMGQKRPELAFGDWQAAMESNKNSNCARMNLGTLAFWRGHSEEGRRLMNATSVAQKQAVAALDTEPGIPW